MLSALCFALVGKMPFDN